MKFLTKTLMSVAAAVVTTASFAAPVFTIGNGVLPGQLGNLTSARTTWATAAAGAGVTPLSTEGFNSAPPAGTDYGPFAIAFNNAGSPFQITNNTLVITEGNSALAFGTGGNTSFTITFDNAINAFGIDLTSIDFSSTTISFADNLGNTLSNFAIPGVFAGATFIGILNSQAFSAVTFSLTGGENIVMGNLRYGVALNQVPLPGALALVLLGLAAGGITRRNRA